MNMRPRASALTAVLLLAAAPLAAQCAMCGESIAAANKEGGADPALAFSMGVLVLLGVVFSLAGGFVLMVVRAARESAPADPGS